LDDSRIVRIARAIVGTADITLLGAFGFFRAGSDVVVAGTGLDEQGENGIDKGRFPRAILSDQQRGAAVGLEAIDLAFGAIKSAPVEQLQAMQSIAGTIRAFVE